MEFGSARDLANAVGHLYKDNEIFKIVGAVNRFNLGLHYADHKRVNEKIFSYWDDKMSMEIDKEIYFLENGLDYVPLGRPDKRWEHRDWDKNVDETGNQYCSGLDYGSGSDEDNNDGDY